MKPLVRQKKGAYLFEIIILISIIIIGTIQIVPYSKRIVAQKRSDQLNGYAMDFYEKTWDYWTFVRNNETPIKIDEINRRIKWLGGTEPFNRYTMQGINLSYLPDVLPPSYRSVLGLYYRGYVYIQYTLDENGLINDITHVYYAKDSFINKKTYIGSFPIESINE